MSNAMSAAPVAMSNAMSGGGMSGRENLNIDPKSPPQKRSLKNEMANISKFATENARSQANITVETAGRLGDQAIEKTGEIAKKLEDSTYTAAANQNVKDAGTSAAQLGQSYTQVGQVADKVAAYSDPAQARLNQMASGELYRPDQVSSQAVSADQAQGARVADVGRMQAAQVNQVSDVRTRGIQASGAERSLMREATGGGIIGQLQQQASNDLALGRSLSAEQSRDATQSSRAAASARGLGLGQSAAASELLNRDRFATQRENERRGFASAVTNQATGIQQAANQAYLGRTEGNRARDLQASLANQATGLQLGQANAQLQQGANAASYDASQQRAMADAGYAQQAGLANQDANLRSAQFNSSQDLAAQNANQSANYNANYANQNFLQGVSSQNFNQFQGQQGMLGSLYGQQAGIAINQYNNNLGLAQANVALDPFQRALGSNIPVSSNATAANVIGQSFGNTMTYGSDLYNTNTNMQASIYNSYMNNNAALQGARLQSDASKAAGNSAMTGSIIGGAGAAVGGAAMAAACCWVARAAFGTATSRWTLYRRAMLRGASDRTIRLYCQYGPAIATRITTPLRRRLARIILCTLELAWK